MSRIGEHNISVCTGRYSYKDVSEGDSLVDAIRNAGITCGTCEHWDKNTRCDGSSYALCRRNVYKHIDFFCADHSKIADK